MISNNFGRRQNNPAKDRKALATYVELKGYKHGGNRSSRCQDGTLILDEIAKELNMSKRNLQRALRIERNLTDSMKELLDTGEITKTFAPRLNQFKSPLYAFFILPKHIHASSFHNNPIRGILSGLAYP